MNLKFDLKKVWPHLIAVILFIIISSIYFSPQLKGYSLNQHDTKSSIGMSKEISDHRQKYDEEPLWTNSTFGGMPAYQISTDNSNVINDLKNYILKMMPRPIGYMVFLMAGFYILLLCFDVNPRLAIIGALAFGLASYNILYLAGGHNSKVHAVSFIPPLIGSIIYGYRKNHLTGSVLLAIFTCLHVTANHLQMTYYLLYLILAIAIVQGYIQVKEKCFPKFIRISTFLLIGGILGLLPPIANIIVTKEYSEHTIRGKSELTISADETSKAKASKNALDEDYIKQYSLAYGEVWSLVIPNVKGGGMGYLAQEEDMIKKVRPELRESVAQFPRYWGEQYATGGAFYFGASIFIIFLLGVFFIKDRMKWAFVATSALAIILSWKYGWLTDLFIDYVPMFNQFRDTKMMLVLVQVSFSLIGVLFLKHLFNQEIDRKKYTYISLGTIALLLLFYITPATWFDFFSKNEQQYFNDLHTNYSNNRNALSQIGEMQNAVQDIRVNIFRQDCLRSLFFISIVAGIIYLYLIKKIKQAYLIMGLGFIILIDLWMVDKRYLNNEKRGRQYTQWVDNYSYRNPFVATKADYTILDAELKNRPEVAGNIETALSKLELPDGLKNIQIQQEMDKIRFRELNFASNYRVLSLAGTFSDSRASYFHKSLGGYHGAKLMRFQEIIEYHLHPEMQSINNVLTDSPTPGKIDSIFKMKTPVLNMLNTKYVIVNTNAQPLQNPYYYGNAWFVDKINYVSNGDEEILALNGINRSTAIIQEKYSSKIPEKLMSDTTATILLEDYRPNHLIYKSITKADQLAIFSEIYYEDGWNAYIDGETADYFKANYLLRGMKIPAGEHKIEFKFEPTSYPVGRKISIIGSGLIILYMLVILFYEIKKRKRTLRTE